MSAKRKVVAIIDDNLRLLGAMSRLLSGLGYQTELYASAQEFLDVAMTSEALCLIVDIQLGDGCGLKLARHLAKAGFTIPIIFMTGNDDDALKKQAMEIGCIAYLLKPFSADVLRDLLTTLPRHSSQNSNKHH
jgi:FixJ family two-component response regulator